MLLSLDEVVGRTNTKASLLKIVKVIGNVSWDCAGEKMFVFS